MSKFRVGDHFAIGEKLTGTVERLFSNSIRVHFDGHNLAGGGPNLNIFTVAWFETVAEPIKVTAAEFFEGLVAGDRFTSIRKDGTAIWHTADYITFLGAGKQPADGVAGHMIQGIRHRIDHQAQDLYFLDDDILTKID